MFNRHARLLTTTLWVLSAGCLTWGTLFEVGHMFLVFSQWGLFYSAAAAAATVWIIMERVNKNIARKGAQDTADAVGVAVGRVLDERDRI